MKDNKGHIELEWWVFNAWYEANGFNKIVDPIKVIDSSIAKYLLLKVKRVLDNNGIPFLLVFGTLLGAYRDKKFIEWDRDIDIAFLKEDKEKVSQLIKEGQFALYGIEWIRDMDHLYSLAYRSEYIDLHFFEERSQAYISGGLDEYVIKKEQLDNPNSKIMFLGEEFNTVFCIEEYLKDQYGENWRTPIR